MATQCPTCGVESEDVSAYVAHFRWRVLQDALAEGTARYWLRRARTFAAVGTKGCDEIAQACRNAAEVWRRTP